jgi:hypothetical protein
MLHITNGDYANSYLKKIGIPGQFQAWQDVLHHGVISNQTDLTIISAQRSQFLAEYFCLDQKKVKLKFSQRDTVLTQYPQDQQIILWLTPELFDCLIGLQFLAWFQASGRAVSCLKVILLADHLPPRDHNADEINQFFKSRFTPPAEFFQLIAPIWQAVTAEKETQRDKLQHCLGLDFKYWPSLKLAMQRFIEELPQTGELSRTQWQILDCLTAKPLSLAQLFGENQQLEEVPFMGDLSFWCIIELMRDLVEIDTQQCILHQDIMFYHQHKISLSVKGAKLVNE